MWSWWTVPSGVGTGFILPVTEGYVDGKDKLHFKIGEMTADHDWRRCGCEPCITVRAVLERVGNSQRTTE